MDETLWFVLDREGSTGAPNWEEQCYRPHNVDVADGQLVIQVSGNAEECDGVKRVPGSTYPLPYSAGGMVSRDFTFRYGVIEFRAQNPGGQGPWPAIWAYFDGCHNFAVEWEDLEDPDCFNFGDHPGEIDFMEILLSRWSEVNQQIHFGSQHGGCKPAVADSSRTAHDYRVEWTPDRVDWFIDGAHTCSVEVKLDSFLFPVINVAVGGAGGGDVLPATLGNPLYVDYFRIFPNEWTETR